jgi:hypothetical protein
MRAPGEVGLAARGDQQFAGARGGIPVSFRKPVLTEFAVRLTQLAVGHVVNDDANQQDRAYIQQSAHLSEGCNQASAHAA